MKTKGAIACGHQKTAEAAAQILAQGGNAFDAVLAAHLTACVAEPVLSSLGGGGFLMAHTAQGNNIVYDFFTHTPQIKRPQSDIDLYPITADFGETTQEFHIGMGSIAVPGSVKGIFEVHRDLGSLPISVISEPAITLAKNGVLVNEFQAYIFDIIKPIYQRNETCYELYKSPSNINHRNNSAKKLIQSGEILMQGDLANTLEALTNEGEKLFYHGEIADAVIQACKENGGLLTKSDFNSYTVIKRKPLALSYRNHRILTNPPPSSGGILIAFALSLLQTVNIDGIKNQSFEFFELLSLIMQLTNKARIETECTSSVGNAPANHLDVMDPDMLSLYQKTVAKKYSFNRGTTQISIIDEHGNVASLTTSNGEGSSYSIPGSGIILNNMLGEEDLNPGGFNRWQENQRISSMMAPTIIFDKKDNTYAIGSGGSNRIRSAILQVLVQLLDYNCELKTAVESPRIHLEDGLLNIEAGISSIEKNCNIEGVEEMKYWNSKNLFFGGVHCVQSINNILKGKGDPRRGGVSITV